LAASEMGDETQAARLLTLVLNHSLTDHWTRERTERKLTELAPDMPIAVLDTAPAEHQASELEEIVVEVLSQRDAWLGQVDGHRIALHTLE
jgi:hypothetical protein